VESSVNDPKQLEEDATVARSQRGAEPAVSVDLEANPRPWPHDGVVRVWTY
jgi:hypothetical protein